MIDEVLDDLRQRMNKSVEALQDDLMGIRTGRASPALVEKLPVEYYGTVTLLNQMASIAAPEPRLLVIRPLIRLNSPRLTEERRRDLVRVVARRVEEARVSIRNLRRDALQDLKEFEKEKMISEDDFYLGKDKVQELTDKFIETIDQMGARKETEVMEI
jgi:ribosome recycling factor